MKSSSVEEVDMLVVAPMHVKSVGTKVSAETVLVHDLQNWEHSILSKYSTSNTKEQPSMV